MTAPVYEYRCPHCWRVLEPRAPRELRDCINVDYVCPDHGRQLTRSWRRPPPPPATAPAPAEKKAIRS